MKQEQDLLTGVDVMDFFNGKQQRLSLNRMAQWILIAVLLLTVLPVEAAQLFINLNGEQTVIETQTGVAESGLQSGLASFTVDDNQAVLAKTGQPAIPYQIVRLLLPPNAKLDAVITQLNAAYALVEGAWSVSPVPPMATRDENGNEIVIWPSDRTIVDGYDVDLYNTDDFWPAAEAIVANTGRLRSWKIAEVAVPLFRYNPVTGQLLELSEAELFVDSGKENGNAPKNRKKEHQKNKERVRDLVVNYVQAAAAYEDAEAEVDFQIAAAGEEAPASPTLTDTGYVIITTNAIQSASTKLASFVAHKQARGYTVNVITESQYGSGTGDAAATNVRTWLKNNYNNTAYGAGGILYVLLIGDPRTDSASVPMKMCISDHPTDYYYAELTSNWDADGDGIFGESEDTEEKNFEVYVGRIPYYGTISQTDAILQKIINYESATNTNWRRNALLPMVPLDASTPCYQIGEQIKYNLLEPQGIRSTRIYDETYGLSPEPEYLRSNRYPATEWAQGIYGMVIWETHGWDQGASGVITTGDTPNLNNNYPSAVWQGSCSTGTPETTTNLGYSILKNGGIGTVAASRSGWYWVGESNYTNSSSQGGLGYQYAKRLAERKTIGQALWDSKEAMSYWQKNYFVHNLYGDPSVTVMPPLPAFMVTPTHGLQFNMTYGGATTASSAYTLKNNSTAALNWTAVTGGASWYSLSAYSGTVSAQGTKTVTITLSAQTASLPVGKFTDTITFTDTTNTIIEQRTVTLQVYPKRKVAYWPLDNTTGTIATDVSGNGLDGTVTNTTFDVASVPGKFGTALQFDGSDDHIEIPAFSENLSQLTISVWVKATNWNGNRRIIQKGGDSSEYRLLVEGGKFVFEVGSTRLELTTLPAVGTWVHIVAVYDGSAMKVYYDKVLKGSIARTGQVATSSKAYIGSKNAGAPAGDRFYGIMDEVRLYNHAKDTAGIEALYNGYDSAEPVNPYDGSVNVLRVTNLQWIMGATAVYNDVYFGTDYNAVLNADTTCRQYKGRQTDAIFTPGTLKHHTTYFWRIDQVDASAVVTPGPVWQFTTGNGTGGITRQVWNDISGNPVTNLTGNANYPNNPNSTEILTRFQGPTNVAENYGSRVYGFLIPPATGSYTFWIASDDYSELWLSTDKNPANAVKIAYVNGATGSCEWTKFTSQKSASVSLTANKPYYIMALHKEGAGDDNLAVAFSGPNLAQDVISGQYLMPYAADYDWGPSFPADGLTAVDALEGYVYQGNVAGTASAFDGGAVTYSKAAGPLWLQVASNGTLSGVPGDRDGGNCIFEIRATDTDGASNQTLLSVNVQNTFTGERGLDDFAQLSSCWLHCGCGNPACDAADLTGDGAVELADMLSMADMWLVEKPYGDLTAQWTFDVDASDAVGGHHGNLMGGAVITQTQAVFALGAGALSLDGVNDYVEIPNYKGITGGASRTCSLWLKTTVLNKEVLSWGSTDNGGKWLILLDANGQLRVSVNGGYIAGTTVLTDGLWHHIAIVLNDDGTPDIAEAGLYVDGVLETVSSFTAMPVNTGSTQNVQMGFCQIQGSNRYFSGLMDDVRLYERALTSQEIQKLCTSELQVYLSLDETSGTTAIDRSLYSRNGVLMNGPVWEDSAVRFDGINDYIEVTGYKGIVGGGARTCGAWIKTTVPNKEILSWGSTDDGGKWLILLDENGRLRVSVGGGYSIGSTVLTDGQWHHVAVALANDGSPDISEAKFYVDGQLETISLSGAKGVNTGSTQNVQIGYCQVPVTGRFFNGLIDEVRVYDYALTGQEIQQIIN
jgi:hypothetical protein